MVDATNGKHGAAIDPSAPASGKPRVERTWKEELSELAEYLRHYVEVRKDSVGTRLQKLLLQVIMGAIAGIAALAAVAVAVTLALVGLADLLGDALGERYWAGKLIVGFGLIAGIGVGLFLYRSRSLTSLRTKTLAKYEQRHNIQRQRFGRDVTNGPRCH